MTEISGDGMLHVTLLPSFSEFLFRGREVKRKRFVIVYGGAGSGKSYSVAVKICYMCATNPNVQCLVTRKTFPALRITAYPMIIDTLQRMNIPFQHNKSAGMMVFENGSSILFKSMDDPEKIKSLTLDLVWIEEATDYNYEDFLQINLRLRGNNLVLNQCYMTFNPIDEFHWLNTEMLQKRKKECAIHQSTYKDNFMLPETYVTELEALKDFDENHYRIYTQGLFGRLIDVIYTNWDIIEKMPQDRYDCYGLDFGFTHPAALIGIQIRDGTPTVKELIYQTHLTNPELIERLKVIITNRGLPIYADPAEPKSIADIQAAGFNVQEADNSVWDGIKKVKTRPIHIHKDSTNLIKEIRSYTWRKDSHGRVLEEPVKFMDHALDAMRYAINTYWGGTQIPGSILDIRAKMRERTFDDLLQPMPERNKKSDVRAVTRPPELDW